MLAPSTQLICLMDQNKWIRYLPDFPLHYTENFSFSKVPKSHLFPLEHGEPRSYKCIFRYSDESIASITINNDDNDNQLNRKKV